jgi:hypothetical protein
MSLSPNKLAPLETAKAVRVRLARGTAGNLATDTVDVGLRIPRR